MSAKKISFLIPSKNRLDLLKYATSSILAQNDQDIEIVVSDNASEEDYQSYIDQLSDTRIIYHRLPQPVSVTKNWQSALALSTGDYVLMLGDDDALTPDFTKVVRPFLSDDGPDVIYLASYHYGYPNVLDFKPSGYLAVVQNSEFLLGADDPFCLTRNYARELAASILDFRYRFGFNAQHFLLKSAFVKKFDADGGIYQSPYPDTFAATVAFTHARSILVMPRGAVIIGISPKSFGAYYFSNRHEEGIKFLANDREEAALRSSLTHVILPGDQNNTNWLIAAEATKRLTGLALSKDVNFARYRTLQMVSVLRERYLFNRTTDKIVGELKSKLTPTERSVFEMLEVAVGVAWQADQVILQGIFAAIDQALAQFVKAKIRFLDIGSHQTIADAFLWLTHAPEAWSIGDETEVGDASNLKGERAVLMEKCDALVAERDALVAERDALVAERDALERKYSAITNSVLWRFLPRALRRMITGRL